ncbi:uncharacterized protein ZBIST_1118 [Zygosaccharomyces bailii]|nr:uncharacterized protein ZBIST_1118 [Zygosaccharomyces bailii]
MARQVLPPAAMLRGTILSASTAIPFMLGSTSSSPPSSSPHSWAAPGPVKCREIVNAIYTHTYPLSSCTAEICKVAK